MEIENMKIDQISVSKCNVRKASFDTEGLVESIKTVGIKDPITVRPIKDKFEVVKGQRRLVAAQMAKLKVVPVIVKKMNDEEALTESLLENIREDLDPLDRANAINGLINIEKKKGKSMRSAMPDIAKKIGMKEGTIWENLSLLGLTKEVKEKVSKKKIPVHVAARLKTIPKKKQLKVAREVEGMPREKAMKVIEQVKAEPEKSVKEAKKEVEKQEGYSVRVSFNGTEYEALKEAAKSLRVSNVNDASRVIVVDWLANQGFLKSTVEKKPDEEAKTEKTGKETKKGEKKLKYGPTGTVEETDDEIDNWENI